jgi:transposase
MRFYTKQHPLYCGIDLHARSMYVCVLSHDGEILLHRNMKAAPEPLRKAVAPYRDGLVVAVECIFTWYWLADLCAEEGIPFVLGHALSANREGVAERFDDAAVHKTIEVDLALITYYDELRKDLELYILKTAKHHDAHTLYLLQTVPGIGKILSLVLLDEIHDIRRFPSVQDFASYCRLVKCSKESGGKRLGTSGKKIGNAHLKWAFSEAATLFLRNNEPGQKLLARLEKKHDKGKALSILAHKLGRAVYFMLKRQVAFDMKMFLQT